MAIPAYLYAISASQALPAVAVMSIRGRRPPAPYRLLALLSLFFVLSDVIGIIVSMLVGTNAAVPYFTLPIEAATTLWLLSYWQVSGRMQHALRLLTSLVLVISALLILFADPVRNFVRWIGPSISLATLVLVLETGISRAYATIARLDEQDWFWICGGLALFWLAYVPVDAFATSFLRTHLTWAVAAYLARAALLPISCSMMAFGVWRSRPRSRPPMSSPAVPVTA